MRFFTDKAAKAADDYTIIIGCGRLGSKIANTLSDKGKNVLVMDKSGDSFRRLSSGFGGLNTIGDGTDIDRLQEAQIANASTVVAVTDSDNTNILVAQMAKSLFHVPQVVARLCDPEKRYVFQEEDIHVVCPSLLSAQEINSYMNCPAHAAVGKD